MSLSGEAPELGPLAGVDPGRSKCGLVLTDPQRRQIVAAGVLGPEQTFQQLISWQRQAALQAVVLGNGTGSALWQQRLAARQLVVLPVEERGSTLAARERYWQLQPARGWRRLLPRGLRQPPRDWDDVVAQLLLERWLGQNLSRAPQLIDLQKLARTVKV